MIKLLDIVLERAGAGEPVALATLVRARGSTPQQAGAAMVILADGRTFGTLGGGCTEAETRARALAQLAMVRPPGGPAELLAFKLDHDFGWDDGLICGGVMDVGIEVFEAGQDLTSLRIARDGLAGREVVSRQVVMGEQTFTVSYEPAPRLVIAGAGHVAHALAGIAVRAGFELTVIDDRADVASPDRFPEARRRVGPIDLELARLAVDPHTYVVIVTRGHRNDAAALAAVVGSPARYVGLIGSKRKVRTIFADLIVRGASRDAVARVHAPVGLDLGAVTPEEIAVSICAELIAVRRGVAETRPMKLNAADLQRYLDHRADGDSA